MNVSTKLQFHHDQIATCSFTQTHTLHFNFVMIHTFKSLLGHAAKPEHTTKSFGLIWIEMYIYILGCLFSEVITPNQYKEG